VRINKKSRSPLLLGTALSTQIKSKSIQNQPFSENFTINKYLNEVNASIEVSQIQTYRRRVKDGFKENHLALGVYYFYITG
jgi:hypothetical protein